MVKTKTLNSRWVRYRGVAYFNGKGLVFGAGADPPVNPSAKAPNQYSINIDPLPNPKVEVCSEVKDLDFFKLGAFNYVFAGINLGKSPTRVRDLSTLASLLKVGGHIVFHQLEEDWKMDQFLGMLERTGKWQTKDLQTRDGQIFGVLKLLGPKGSQILPIPPRTQKRACIVRYGAIGDLIILTPLLEELHRDGFHVTVNISPYGQEVLKYNPYIDNYIFQQREAIPNSDLGEYWNEWKGEYDRYINLSESLEGTLLKVEGRQDFFTTQVWRHSQVGDINYYDRTLALGGYLHIKGKNGQLFFSKEEEKNALKVRRMWDSFDGGPKWVGMWAVKGSSPHKLYPILRQTIEDWVQQSPDRLFLLTGGPADKDWVFDHPQVISLVGEMGVREVFSLIPKVQCVVGPETSLTNAAGCFPEVDKVVLLSHSSPENLTKYWTNCTSIQPSGAPCYPCHQLHYSSNSCPKGQLVDGPDGEVLGEYPLCTTVIHPTEIWDALDKSYLKWKEKVPAF